MKPSVTPLSKLLVNPSKIAHALDWQRASGSVHAMNILRDRIDLAIASHPFQGRQGQDSAHPLPSIPIKTEFNHNKLQISRDVSLELQNIVERFHVCGAVVNWPVQREGWCGSPCGRVLYTLGHITSSSAAFNKPICLWDEEHHVPPEDDWGRSPFYTETCLKSIHKASTEQYKTSSTPVPAISIWNDFFRSHWPDLYHDPSILSHPSRPWSAPTSRSHNIRHAQLQSYDL